MYIYITLTYECAEIRDEIPFSHCHSFVASKEVQLQTPVHTLPPKKESIRLQERARVVRLTERSKSSLSHLLLPRNCQSIERADLKWLRLAKKLVDDFCTEL